MDSDHQHNRKQEELSPSDERKRPSFGKQEVTEDKTNAKQSESQSPKKAKRTLSNMTDDDIVKAMFNSFARDPPRFKEQPSQVSKEQQAPAATSPPKAPTNDQQVVTQETKPPTPKEQMHKKTKQKEEPVFYPTNVKGLLLMAGLPKGLFFSGAGLALLQDHGHSSPRNPGEESVNMCATVPARPMKMKNQWDPSAMDCTWTIGQSMFRFFVSLACFGISLFGIISMVKGRRGFVFMYGFITFILGITLFASMCVDADSLVKANKACGATSNVPGNSVSCDSSSYAGTVVVTTFNSVFCFVAAVGAFRYIRNTNPDSDMPSNKEVKVKTEEVSNKV